MSQENESVIADLIDASNRQDVGALVALVSPDVEWEDPAFWSEPGPNLQRESGTQRVVQPGRGTLGKPAL